MTGHQYTGKWTYSRTRKLWRRKCVIGTGMCTAVETAPKGHKPKGQP